MEGMWAPTGGQNSQYLDLGDGLKGILNSETQRGTLNICTLYGT